jgi:hypothetical protein
MGILALCMTFMKRELVDGINDMDLFMDGCLIFALHFTCQEPLLVHLHHCYLQ